ncbi:uncharacterized protein LOC144663744 isoform X3 [Oculina patagonica]
MLFYAVVCLLIRSIASCDSSKCSETSSVQNYRLTGHVIVEQPAKTMFECIKACDKHQECRSVNFKLLGLVCQLNKADARIAYHHYIPATGYVYSNNPWPKIKLKSCAEIKEIVPDAKSGYYWIDVNGKKKEVFCDMVNYGGGWTLVVSISSSDNNHLNREEVNCLLPNRCVEHVTSNIPTRKLSDEDIHEIATTEGLFRVDQITGGYTVFYQIPIGADMFNSECSKASCPRIIVSHTYPYQWESNCKGTELGYHIANGDCYRVFDSHDNQECGQMWRSSKHRTNRLLYGYPCSGTGIFNGNQGLLFVK